MGFRFRKSVNFARGVRLNVNAKSVGLSVGGRGLRLGYNPRSGTHVIFSIPGTGLSYTQRLAKARASNLKR
jgi:hypothetical protein